MRLIWKYIKSTDQKEGRSGAVSRLPFEASGFAPRTSRKSLRSTSGIGTVRPPPNIAAQASIFGSWSTLEAEKRRRVPSPRSRAGRYRIEPMSWAFGFPT